MRSRTGVVGDPGEGSGRDWRLWSENTPCLTLEMEQLVNHKIEEKSRSGELELCVGWGSSVRGLKFTQEDDVPM